MFVDALTELVRQSAQRIIAQAVEAELSAFLSQYQHLRDEQGRKAVVRNGYLPERTIVTGVGEVSVQVPKVRDRTGSRTLAAHSHQQSYRIDLCDRTLEHR